MVGYGATISGSAGTHAVNVGDLATLDLEGVNVTGGTGNQIAGVFCGSIDHISIANLTAVNVYGNDSGVDGPACQLTILDSMIHDNVRAGVNVGATAFFPAGSSLRLERSRVLGNPVAGVSANNSTFTIVNNFIGGNGTASGGSGVYLNGGGGGTFNFNTVANNGANDSGPVGGVYCGITSAPTFSSNISYGNKGTGDVSGNCGWQNSNIGVGGPAGNGNISQNPLFVSAAAPIYNYHLQSGSPCRNGGSSSGYPATDIDREARPTQGVPEMGADEIP